jgi:hypothetical protein
MSTKVLEKEGTLAMTTPLAATYESLNFELPAQQRRCFFENIHQNELKRKVVVFVQEGGDMEVLFTIHGPLEASEAAKVMILVSRISHVVDPLLYFLGIV